jgi:hypothetical protein
MPFKWVMTKRFCLSVGVSVAVASVLLAHRSQPAEDADRPGVVYVYFPSLCAKAGDPGDCREIPRSDRPSFDSMAACSAHADVELRLENNPRLMASCIREREG